MNHLLNISYCFFILTLFWSLSFLLEIYDFFKTFDVGRRIYMSFRTFDSFLRFERQRKSLMFGRMGSTF